MTQHARRRTRLATAAALLTSILTSGGAAALHAQAAPVGEPLPESALAVEGDGRWHTWWTSARAPARWAAPHRTLAGAVRWRAAAPGVEWSELRLAGSGLAWRVRVVLVRLDPARVTFDVVRLARDDGRPAWAADSAPHALVAINAGQFAADRPWGWVVRDGRELQPPGSGPLSMAFVVDTAGRARLVRADSIAAVRASGTARTAFQSYPALLVGDGAVPPPLHAGGRGVDVGHRDARLAIGELRDGRLLVALTRFEGLGGALEILPLGPTTPEMAALLGALGARQAVLLDGGLSAQLRLRTAGGVERWPGLRRVPLGLVVRGR